MTQYRRFGRTGLQVSEIGLGLWGMGGWTGSDDDQSRRALRLALELGCNFFDTAWAYGAGKSDRLLGELIREAGAPLAGAPVIAASKIPPRNGKWPGRSSDRLGDVFPRDYVIGMAERIREALGTDAIDILQYHVWDDSWTGAEFLDTVAELKERKLIRWFGLSLNRWEAWNGLKAIATGAVDAVQVIYNIFDQSPEDELFAACAQQDVGLIARVPLDEGSLAGNLTVETRFPAGDWRATYFGPENLGPTVERVERLKPLVPRGMTLPEMALRFILANSAVSTTIAGMRQASHVRQNLASSDGVPLPSSLLAELRAQRWERKPRPWAD